MKPNVSVQKFKSLDELSQAAAREFVQIVTKSVNTHGQCLVALSGGSTPTRLYKLLANEKVDWPRVHFFWGDERCVPADDDGNNYGQAKKVLFDKIDLPLENIHRVKSDLEPQAAAEEYSATLKHFAIAPLDWPRFDIVLLGMGDDGHTASLFPNSPIDKDKPVIAVTAHYQDRPANRVSLTELVINSAKNIFFLVSGAGKAETLKRVLSDAHTPDELPAQRIDPVKGRTVWFVDEDAARFL